MCCHCMSFDGASGKTALAIDAENAVSFKPGCVTSENRAGPASPNQAGNDQENKGSESGHNAAGDRMTRVLTQRCRVSRRGVDDDHRDSEG